MFKSKEDNSQAIITAEKHIKSCHKKVNEIQLPNTAVLFFMYGGIEYMLEHYNCETICDKFPRFLNSCPIYKAVDHNFCFLHGGYSAPQAVDTIETLKALGVENVISIGMFGAFSDNVDCGDIIIPSKAFVEEGTSLHYYDSIMFSTPNTDLHSKAIKFFKCKNYPIVSTDSVYRQTFYKEKEWRTNGAVGVDMETSALFSVGKYLDLKVVSILIASDKHPQTPSQKEWKWHMPKHRRLSFFKKCISFVIDSNT